MTLPKLNVSISCGSCGDDVEHDVDSYRCFECGLMWGTNGPFDETPAEFFDENATPCGHVYPHEPYVSTTPLSTVNGVVQTWRTWTTTTGACHLPSDHAGPHDYPLNTTYTEQDGTA